MLVLACHLCCLVARLPVVAGWVVQGGAAVMVGVHYWLRQRLSVCEAESEAAAGLKKQLAAAGAAVAARREAVFESLEELRCEAADLEE